MVTSVSSPAQINTTQNANEMVIGAVKQADGSTMVIYAGLSSLDETGVITGMWGRVLSATGAPTGVEINVQIPVVPAGYDGFDPDDSELFAMPDGTFMLVYGTRLTAANGSSTDSSVYVQRYSATGAQIGAAAEIGTPSGNNWLESAAQRPNGGFDLLVINYSALPGTPSQISFNSSGVLTSSVPTSPYLEAIAFDQVGNAIRFSNSDIHSGAPPSSQNLTEFGLDVFFAGSGTTARIAITPPAGLTSNQFPELSVAKIATDTSGNAYVAAYYDTISFVPGNPPVFNYDLQQVRVYKVTSGGAVTLLSTTTGPTGDADANELTVTGLEVMADGSYVLGLQQLVNEVPNGSLKHFAANGAQIGGDVDLGFAGGFDGGARLIKFGDGTLGAIFSGTSGAVDANGVDSYVEKFVTSAATLSISATSADKAESNLVGGTAFTFTVTRGGDTSGAASANWAVTNGSAIGGDFIGSFYPSGTVSFAAGETSKVISVNVLGDIIAELDETFVVTLSGASANASIVTATATGFIRNDDGLGGTAFNIAAVSADKAEGNAGSTPFTFNVTRSGDTSVSNGVNWAVTGAGVTGADFVGGTLPTGSLTFGAGETSKSITVNVAGDATFEPDETFAVSISIAPIGASAGASIGIASANGVIRNDDLAPNPSLSIAATSADKSEGNSGANAFTFTVTRSGDLVPAVSANWQLGGPGVNGGDFVGGVLPSGTVSFASGEISKVITVNVQGDTLAEADENFTVTLSNPSNATIGTATASGNIRNDDSGTAIMPTLTKLADAPNLFSGSGYTWYRAQRAAWNGDPIYVDQRALSASYNGAGPNAVDLVLVGSDRFADVSPYSTVVASYTTGLTVNGVEVSDKSVALYRQPNAGTYSLDGGVYWVEPTAGVPGAFDIKFRSFTFRPAEIATDSGFADVTLAGSTITVKAGIANFNFMDFDWSTLSNPVHLLGYTTRAAGSGVMDVFYRAFDQTGTAIGPEVQVADDMRAGGATAVINNGLTFNVLVEKITGGVASIEARSFNPITGALGPVSTIGTNFATTLNMNASAQSDGTFDLLVEGKTSTNQHFINIYQASSTFGVSAAPLVLTVAQNNGVRFNMQRMSNDSLVLAYTDSSQVHLVLINAAGALVDDIIVPGITNFDRVRGLGQNQFELVWRETVAGNENVVKTAVYDANTSARIVDNSASTTPNYMLGSRFDDNLKGGSANDVFKGYTGNDTIDGGAGRDEVEYTGNKADYTLVRNGNGSWTVTDTRVGSPDGVDTLTNVEQLDFANGQRQLIMAQPVQIQDLGGLFKTGGADFSGVVWGRAQRWAWNGDPILLNNYVTAANHTPGGPNVQSLVITGQDRFGDAENVTQVATYTSAQTVNNVEVTDKGVVLITPVSPDGQLIQGAAFWVQPTSGGPAGAFDIKLQALTYRAGNLAYNTSSSTVAFTGGQVTVASGIANYESMDWTTASGPAGGKFLIAYAARAANATTREITLFAFDPATGLATSPVTSAGSFPASSYWMVTNTNFNDGRFHLYVEDNSSQVAEVTVGVFDPVTGPVGSTVSFSTKNLGNIISMIDAKQSDGTTMLVVEGTELGTSAHVLQFIRVNSAQIVINEPVNIVLNSQANLGRIQLQLMPNGLNAVGYTDNNQVHLALIDPFGNVVSNTIIPNITNFDRLRSLGQNQVEVIWRETVSGNENIVKGAIFDVNAEARFVDNSASSTAQWLLGSTQADTLRGGSAPDIFKGYGGNDIIIGNGGTDEADYTGLRSEYTVTSNANGTWTVTDNRANSPDGTDTLTGIEKLQFKDQVMSLTSPPGVSPLVKLAELGPLFSNSGGPITGQNWSRSHRAAFNGDVLLVDSYTPANTFVSGGPNPQFLVVTGQTRFGDQEKFTTFVSSYYSAKTVFNQERLDKGVVLFNQPSSAVYSVNGGVFWVEGAAGGPAGSFDIKFQGLTFRPPNIANDTGLNSVALVGSAKTLVAGIANFSYTDWDWNSTTLVIGYSTLAINAATRDFWYQGFDTTGTSSGPATKLATLNTSGVANMIADGAGFLFFSENNTAQNARLDIKSFNPATGGVGATVSIETGLSDIRTMTQVKLNDGTWNFILEGTETASAKHVVKIVNTTASYAVVGEPATIELVDSGNLSVFNVQKMANDYQVFAYVDNNQVHITLINALGGVDSDYVVPGLTTFDRIRGLGQNQFELIWRETVAGNENVVKGAIFDVNIGARVIDGTNATGSQWTLGSELGDTLTGSAFNDIFKGYAGNDVINGGAGVNEAKYTGARADYSIVKNGNGSWTVTDNRANSPDGTDTLRNVQVLDFTDGVIALGLTSATDTATTVGGVASGNVLANDTGPDNDPITVGAVNGLSTGVGISIPGTYGNLVINANGTFTYTVTNAAGGVGTHLHDVFTYAARDAKIAAIWPDIGQTGNTTLDITINRPVEITAASTVALPHRVTSAAIGSLISATDFDGDTIQKYEFYDGGLAATSGSLVVNNVVKASGVVFEVSAAEFAQTTYRSGTTNDALSVRAFDGYEWSAWKQFTATPGPESAPVVTANTLSPSHFEGSRAATGIFSVTDADADAIVKYEVLDVSTDPESGRWTLNGSNLPSNTVNEVLAANLANLSFSFGVKPDTAYVRAFDGVLWSAWKVISVNGVPNAVPVLAGPPVVTPAHSDTSLAATSLFTVSDPDGDSITAYQFYDVTANASSGGFRVNGAAQPALQVIDVTAANLPTVTFGLGSVADTVYVRANDGFAWSDWRIITVNAPPNAVPIIANDSFTPGHTDTVLPAASLFSASDPDGDSLTRYQFYDVTADASSGSFRLNGVAQASMQLLDITDANLPTLGFSFGSMADTIYVRANDGLAWSEWRIITVNPPPNAIPVVTGQIVSPVHGATQFAVTSLFTATDADNDAITRYQFYDLNADPLSGTLKLSGIAQAPLQLVEVTAANLGTALWSFGSVGDQLYVRVFDGLAWSDWKISTVNAPPNAAPVVTGGPVTPSHGVTSLLASTMFSASDPDLDSITKYQLYDADINAASGSFKIGGVTQGALQVLDVTAANLGNVTWAPGSVGDTIYVRASDGLLWSDWKVITVNAPPNAAPVVTGGPVNPLHGVTSLPVTTLFGTTDADNDAMTQYQLYDASVDAASGGFRISGVMQGALQVLDVTAANLANVTWAPGSVGDTIYVRANDGYVWSDWKVITVNAPPNAAPVVTGGPVSPAHGVTSIAASTMFGTTDADNDAMTRYQLYDASVDAASGSFKISGVTQGALQVLDVTAANLANVTWAPGAMGDTVFVRANDGYVWSDWKVITVNAPPNIAPVVTGGPVSPAHGATSLPASGLFGVADGDGDTITKYQFYDATADATSGGFKIGGVTQGAQQVLDVTAANLPNVTWAPGAMGDAVYVRANDGLAWSDWKLITVNAPPNVAPVVTATDQSVAHGATLAASTLVTTTDGDGDAPTKYQLYDATTAEGSGNWKVNGLTQTPGQLVDVTAADLANTSFASGSGQDLLFARAFDGLAWSDWKAFTVTAPLNAAAVVNAGTANLSLNQNVAASSLFSVTDAENDVMTKYQFWDNNTGGTSGKFKVNGVNQAAQTVIDVLAADLANVNFTAASAAATDQLFVRAFDGYVWSNWKGFDAVSA
jgi:hypothetical protein